MIEIDGSVGEGGGQILRSSLSLSAVTGKAFRLTNIRKGRKEPGLLQQHLACVKACALFCNATVDGASLGSECIEFVPRQLKNRQLELSIGTAGSALLVAQSILLPLMFTESEIKISGGTDVKWSIPYDYFNSVMLPLINEYSEMEVSLERRGYYPKGQGIVRIRTKPRFKIIDFDTFPSFQQYVFASPIIALHRRGRLVCIKGVSHASKDLQGSMVAERQARTAELMLKKSCPTLIDIEYSNAESTGSGIILYAIYRLDNSGNERQYRICSDELGERGLKAEEVGRIASERLLAMIKEGVVVDEHLQDNIIPLLGLFGGKILAGAITAHTKANIATCEKFLNVDYRVEPLGSGGAGCDANEDCAQSVASFISVLSSIKS